MKKRSVFAPVYITLVLLLMYLPILVVVVFSFNGNATRNASIQFSGFSFQWYEGLFSPEKGYIGALLTSLRVALSSVAVSAVIGTLGAVAMVRRRTRQGLLGRVGDSTLTLFEQLTLLPIMIPEIILGIAFLALFSAIRLPFGEITLVISHITFCIPYIYITVKGRLATLDPALQEAARDLGASPFRAFLTVTLPLIAPAVLSGSLLAFAMSMDDFVISFFVNGAETTTLPLKIYSSVKVGVTPSVNALCTVMLGMAFLIFGISQAINTTSEARRRRHEEAARSAI
jgi:spermidine/putrescine transport system permease protein